MISAGEPPLPPNSKYIPQNKRKYRPIYAALLQLCAGVRILASRTISMAQAKSGQEFFMQYCRSLKKLNIHTTINHHLSMHYLKFIKLFGPIYGWWLFAFERFNGMLEKVKHNGHDGGRMELTLMRQWVMTHLLYEYLLALPEDAHELERAYIDRIIRQEGRENRGGMMTELAIYRAEASAGNDVSLPRCVSKPLDISRILPNGASYGLLLRYVQALWPDLNVIDDNSLEEGTPFYRSKATRPLAYVRKNGIRYSSTSNRRTNADSVAFIYNEPNGRIPVEIIALLSVQLGDKAPHVCAIVRPMHVDDNIPSFPWDL